MSLTFPYLFCKRSWMCKRLISMILFEKLSTVRCVLQPTLTRYNPARCVLNEWIELYPVIEAIDDRDVEYIVQWAGLTCRGFFIFKGYFDSPSSKSLALYPTQTHFVLQHFADGYKKVIRSYNKRLFGPMHPVDETMVERFRYFSLWPLVSPLNKCRPC